MKDYGLLDLDRLITGALEASKPADGSLLEQIREAVLMNLGIDRKEFEGWKTADYRADVPGFFDVVERAKTVWVVGDYDADGICGSYVMSQGLRSLYPDKEVHTRIPKRFSEGYGLHNEIIDEIAGKCVPGETVIVTVDNGISAGDVLEYAREKGFLLVVTDHHEHQGEPPCADFVIDPKAENVENPLENDLYCGAGVAYKILEPRLSGEMKEKLRPFAALATVADIMPLRRENWLMVREVLADIRKGKMPEAFRLLFSVHDRPVEFVDEEDFGFLLGPVFNAAGRLSDDGASDVLAFLEHPDMDGANALKALNTKRKEMTKEMEERVEEYIETNGLSDSYPLWACLPGLAPGLVGNVAGKIAEKYNRPCLLSTMVNGMVRGSARSHDESFNMYEYMAGMKDLFASFGGHAGAAGFSLTEENFQKAAENVTRVPVTKKKLSADVCLSHLRDIVTVCEDQKEFAPFGEGNPRPLIRAEVDVKDIRAIGADKTHLSVDGNYVSDFSERGRYKVIRFGGMNELPKDADRVGITGYVKESAFRGTVTPQLFGEELERGE